MPRAKALTYEEFIEYARKHYDRGGDAYFECWDRRTFDEYVRLFGPVTKRKALEMFRFDRAMEKERAGWY